MLSAETGPTPKSAGQERGAAERTPLQVLRDLRGELVRLRRNEADKMLGRPGSAPSGAPGSIQVLQAEIEAVDDAILDEVAIAAAALTAEAETLRQSPGRLTRVQILEKEQLGDRTRRGVSGPDAV